MLIQYNRPADTNLGTSDCSMSCQTCFVNKLRWQTEGRGARGGGEGQGIKIPLQKDVKKANKRVYLW